MHKKDIMPFHLFHYQGKHYLINIESMRASSVDEITSHALEMIGTEPETLLPMGMEENLKKLGLIPEIGGKSKESGKEEPFSIVNMALFLTQSCNLKCIYCYGDGGEYGASGSLDVKTAYQAVDWLIEQSRKMKKIHIGFFGGEPFLNFSIMKSVVEYAKKRTREVGKDVDFHTNTNATVLGDEQIVFIKEHNIDVMVSIDGPREVQDKQRPYSNGNGSYDSIVPNIKKLLAVLPETPGHAVIVGNTDPQRIKDAMQEIGFRKVSIMPASQSLFSEEPDKEKSTRDTQTLLQSLEQETEIWLELTQNRDSKALKSLKNRGGLTRGLLYLLHNNKNIHACGAGLGLVAVSISGGVYLCHRFVGRDEFKLGSITEKELNRDEYLKSSTTGNEKCAACFARYYCAGGCKHDNVGSCGSIAAPSEDMCRLRCRELELAASIVSRLEPDDHSFLIEHNIFTPKPCPFDF